MLGSFSSLLIQEVLLIPSIASLAHLAPLSPLAFLALLSPLRSLRSNPLGIISPVSCLMPSIIPSLITSLISSLSHHFLWVSQQLIDFRFNLINVIFQAINCRKSFCLLVQNLILDVVSRMRSKLSLHILQLVHELFSPNNFEEVNGFKVHKPLIILFDLLENVLSQDLHPVAP